MTGAPKGQSVLVIGRGGGLARGVALAALDAGAHVTAAGRDQEHLAAAYAAKPGVSIENVDLTDEGSIAALGDRLGSVDHVVSTASARARGRVADLDRDAIMLSFDTKVIGPLMLAKYLAPRMSEGGSFAIFSGVAAAKITVARPGRVSGRLQPGILALERSSSPGDKVHIDRNEDRSLSDDDQSRLLA